MSQLDVQNHPEGRGRSNDARIVRLIEERNEDGLEELFSNHGAHIKTRLLNYFGENREHDIDEAISDAGLAAWDRIGQYNPRYPLSAWLLAIAKNYVIAMIRKEQARPILRLLRIDELDELEIPEATRSERTIQFLRHVHDCIAQLSPMRQDIILTLLVRTEDSGNQVLAKRWDTSPNAISKARQKARIQLGKLLRKAIR